MRLPVGRVIDAFRALAEKIDEIRREALLFVDAGGTGGTGGAATPGLTLVIALLSPDYLLPA